MQLTETDKAYFAGLFDGEGCVGYYERQTKGVSYHSASLHVCMTDARAVRWIQEHVGYGRISFSEKPGHRKSVYSWQLCNKPQIQEVLTAIRPYLKVKADQVDLLFTLWAQEADFPSRVVSNELIVLRQHAAEEIKRMKQMISEGVETRRAGSQVH